VESKEILLASLGYGLCRRGGKKFYETNNGGLPGVSCRPLLLINVICHAWLAVTLTSAKPSEARVPKKDGSYLVRSPSPTTAELAN
jgi:hypothetical protein